MIQCEPYLIVLLNLPLVYHDIFLKVPRALVQVHDLSAFHSYHIVYVFIVQILLYNFLIAT